MNIPSVDLNANISVVCLEEVESTLCRANVALSWKWSHGDGVSVLEQGHAVAQGSIHVVLAEMDPKQVWETIIPNPYNDIGGNV